MTDTNKLLFSHVWEDSSIEINAVNNFKFDSHNVKKKIFC